MNQLTKRKLSIGIIHSCLFIFLQVHLIIIRFDPYYMIDFIGISNLIYQVCGAYLIISILILIRKIVINNRRIVKYLNGLILLELVYILTSLSQYIGFYYAKLFTVLSAVGMLIISVILGLRIFSSNETNHRIVKLRPILNAFIFAISSVILTALIAYVILDYQLYTKVMIYMEFLNIIPYLLLINYFRLVRKEFTHT